MKVYGECNIVINPNLGAKPMRRRSAEVNMDIITSQGVNAVAEPITLVIKGANFARVFELMTTHHKTDEEIAEKVRGSVLVHEVDGMTTEEVAAWARGNIVAELEEMSKETP